MRGRRAQQPLADLARMNGKLADALFPVLPNGSDFTASPPHHLSSASSSSAAASFLPSASPVAPASPTASLPLLSDDLPLLEDGDAGSPPVCPDCSQQLSIHEEDGALLLHCPNCLHSRHMTTEPLFPPTSSISQLGALLTRPNTAMDDPIADSSSNGQLSRTVSQLFGLNGRSNSFIPMGDSLQPPSATPSFASTLSFSHSTSTLPPLAGSTSSYTAMNMYDDNGSLDHVSSSSSTANNSSNSTPVGRTMSNAYSAFGATGASFTNWSATPHPSYLSDRDGAALRHVASVSSRPVPTLYQYDIDSSSGRPVARPYTVQRGSGGAGGGRSGGGSNGYGDGELVMEVPRERLSVDRHSLTVVPLAATTPYYRLPAAPLPALHLPNLPTNATATAAVTLSARRLHSSTTSPHSSARHPSPTSASPSSASSSPAASTPSSQDLGAAHYTMISELLIDELCIRLAVRRLKVPDICLAALHHVMRQTECTYSNMQHVWQQQLADSDPADLSAAHSTKAKTSHAVAMASAVFHYVYQRHVHQQDRQPASTLPTGSHPSSSLPSSASSTLRSPPRFPLQRPQLHVSRLIELIADSAEPDNQYPILVPQLSLYIDTITPLLHPLDLDAMSGPPSAATVLMSRPLQVEACRPSFIEYADKFKQLFDADTLVLAVDILNAAVRLNLSSRRNHTSLSAAALFLACCLQAVRLTQHDFCQRIGLTEVTLRKVNKELGMHWRQLVPAEYEPRAVPQFLLKQVASEQKKQREMEQSRLKEEATLVDEDGDSEQSRPVSPTVKLEPMDDTTAAIQQQPSAATGSVRLVYHEPFTTLNDYTPLPLPLTTVSTAVPPMVLTCRHRLSAADSAHRVRKAVSRARASSSIAAVTSDSDTEEEVDDGERTSKKEGSSKQAAEDGVATPAFLPPFVPVFYDVAS